MNTIDDLKELIKVAAESVSSEDILTTTKIAGQINPYIAGGLLGGLGTLGATALLRDDKTEELQRDADTRALIAGLAGAGAGYYAGSNNLLPSVGGPVEDEFSSQDIDEVWR